MLVGERIKELRKGLNLTQEELANLLGVKKVSVQKYENGGINPKTETLEKLGEIFNVSPSYIMGWDKFDHIDTEPIKQELKHIEFVKEFYGFTGVELAHLFKELNDEGRRRLLFYAEDIVDNPKYKNK